MPRLFIPCLLSLLLLIGCQSTPKPSTEELTPDAQRAAALARSARLSGLDYDYQLTLRPSGFEGSARLAFTLTDTLTPLELDAKAMQISGLTINGRYLYPDYQGKKLLLPAKLLNEGDNLITLTFRGEYQSNGEGLISVIDPLDGQQYLYSHFEPNGASRLLPLFDQPDLPATFTLSVSAPAQWQVIGSSQPQACKSQPQPDQYQCKRFSTGELPLSPHNISLHAGPFAVWHLNWADGNLPLGLYARQSQQHLIEPTSWLNNTQSALKALEQRLGTPFPFSKYDQLLMMQDDQLSPVHPHSGAAAVAFVRMTKPDPATLSFQLARQWFGNMVSIDWWHSRWLSDAISHYLAGDAQMSAQQQLANRAIAYETDLLPVSGHAIGEPAYYLADDPIIRTKAVAALNQLQAQLGKDKLEKGLHAYLQQYRGKAASASDFKQTLEQASGQDLDQWQQDFIDSRGVNSLTSALTCRDGVITELKLLQQADEFGRLRHQQLRLGLYHTDRSGIHQDKLLNVKLDGATTDVAQARDLACPDFLWPNEQGLGYIKVRPDSHSLTVSRLQLGQIHNQASALMFWQSLWQMALDGELPSSEYLAKVLLNAPNITDPAVASLIQQQMLELNLYLAVNQEHVDLTDAMAQLSLQRAMETRAMPALQQSWLDTYISLARNRLALDHLSELLRQPKGPLPALTQTQKFNALMQLNRFDYPGVNRLNTLAQKEWALTDTQKLLLRGVSPKSQEKRALLTKLPLLQPEDRKQLMKVLYPPEQILLSQASQDERLTWLLDKEIDSAFKTDVAALILHKECTPAGLDKLGRLSQQLAEPNVLHMVEKQAHWVLQCIHVNAGI